ncbi:hypothetical protein M747DRAFT_344761 [Aspergillus niger ATCC 13496]|uniref:Uncharacterized protein n=1 Tax=Aspergillus niger ATCC 13496 TaxID=1353008 RepID=A0A370BUA9_ASPNG|nr:hypothetical protein M747DRAFT_344761 [Aspergillus niger ATCC 13496]
MAQAAWPQGQSKTAWTDFMTPLKRCTSILKRAFEANITVTKRALVNSERRGIYDELGAVVIMIFIMFCYASAWHGMKVPLHRALRTPGEISHSTREDRYRDALLISSVALIYGFASWVLGLYLRHHLMGLWSNARIAFFLRILGTASNVLLAVVWIRGLYAVWRLGYRYRMVRRRR